MVKKIQIWIVLLKQMELQKETTNFTRLQFEKKSKEIPMRKLSKNFLSNIQYCSNRINK